MKIHVAALPVPYRTTTAEPTFESLTEKDADCAHCIPDRRSFPVALDPFQATRYEIAEFGREAHAMGVNYLGVCCGAGPHHIRALAEALGRKPRGEPLLARHVEALCLRQRRAAEAGEPGIRREAVGASSAYKILITLVLTGHVGRTPLESGRLRKPNG